MTATIFLVRHAAHELLGRALAGRMPGVNLGEAGRRQADQLAERLAREEVAMVQTSPLERTRETAGPIAARLGLTAEPAEALSEIDFGTWSGQSFEALEADPHWSAWNRSKATLRPPGGESMLEAQCRAVSHVERVAGQIAGAGAVLVSHADVIKAVLAYYLGLAIEGIARFEVSPASISTLVLGDWGAKVLCLNEVPGITIAAHAVTGR